MATVRTAAVAPGRTYKQPAPVSIFKQSSISKPSLKRTKSVPRDMCASRMPAMSLSLAA